MYPFHRLWLLRGITLSWRTSKLIVIHDISIVSYFSEPKAEFVGTIMYTWHLGVVLQIKLPS